MGYKDDDPRYMSTMGPFHDELKKAQQRIAELEGERDELTTEVERLGTALVEVRDRIDSLLASKWLGLEDG